MMKCNTCANERYCYDGNHQLTRDCCTDNGFTAYTPMTHGDEIRSLSDYDLADWIAQILMYHGSFSRRPLTIDDNKCPHECPLYKCCNDQTSDNIEDWLKSPVEVDDGN